MHIQPATLAIPAFPGRIDARSPYCLVTDRAFLKSWELKMPAMLDARNRLKKKA
nr:hypothetical protein [Candidatus Sigynarchaeum springense]